MHWSVVARTMPVRLPGMKSRIVGMPTMSRTPLLPFVTRRSILSSTSISGADLRISRYVNGHSAMTKSGFRATAESLETRALTGEPRITAFWVLLFRGE